MKLETLNLNNPPEKKRERREKGSIFSETFKAITLASILFLGAREGFQTAKEMAIITHSTHSPENKDGRMIVRGEVETAAGKKYKYEIPTETQEGVQTSGRVGGGNVFEGNVEEITKDGSGVKIHIGKVFGRDQVEVRTEYFGEGGKLKETTFAYVSAEPQEVSVK